MCFYDLCNKSQVKSNYVIEKADISVSSSMQVMSQQDENYIFSFDGLINIKKSSPIQCNWFHCSSHCGLFQLENKVYCLGVKIIYICFSKNIFICMIFSGGASSLDSECWLDPGEQRPELPAAEDAIWTDSFFPHPADLPLHL